MKNGLKPRRGLQKPMTVVLIRKSKRVFECMCVRVFGFDLCKYIEFLNFDALPIIKVNPKVSYRPHSFGEYFSHTEPPSLPSWFNIRRPPLDCGIYITSIHQACNRTIIYNLGPQQELCWNFECSEKSVNIPS